MQIRSDDDLAGNALGKVPHPSRLLRDAGAEGRREQTLPLMTSALKSSSKEALAAHLSLAESTLGAITHVCSKSAEVFAGGWRSFKALLPHHCSSSSSVRAASQLQTLLSPLPAFKT